ncbi:MAG: arabinan endo-1,5-alpha-L-arabinosidase [Anaerolineales bacterium]|nr:arabinan endo-1,5-alpha-L-arabinosidase [Anaerolineales bacterium]
MRNTRNTMQRAIRWLLLTSTILAGCAVPAAPGMTLTLVPPAPVTSSPLPTPTLDQKLNAMIVETSGLVTNVHDPTMIEADGGYYLVSTGPGIPIRCSKDMQVWDLCGRVFNENPNWMFKSIIGVKDLWAPDIVFYNGQFYLFYTASTFGSNRSAIGLATNTTLDPLSPDYAWVDQGEVISSQKTDNYNAIDPNLTFDQSGQPWLVFGSFWSGIKMVRVDPATLKPVANEKLIDLASNPGTDAVEGAFIIRRGDFFYLFVSHDFCCKGVMSTYNIRVGRSREIQGPYLDREGKPLTRGGGTLVYKGSDRWRGPGHNSIFIMGETYYMVYHAYDAKAGGIPTLRIEALEWDLDGWPQSPSALLGQ